jgi:hypothetical protein
MPRDRDEYPGTLFSGEIVSMFFAFLFNYDIRIMSTFMV